MLLLVPKRLGGGREAAVANGVGRRVGGSPWDWGSRMLADIA